MTQFGLFSEYGENNMYIINFKRPIGAMVKKTNAIDYARIWLYLKLKNG